jgi:hypothetical protein
MGKRQKKFHFGLAWVLLVSGGAILTPSVQAMSLGTNGGVVKFSTEELEPNPWEIISSRMGTEPGNFDGMGVYFDASYNYLYSGLETSPFSFLTPNDPSVWDWSLCSNLNSVECLSPDGRVLQAHSILGLCQTADELGCIEDLRISIGGSSPTTMSFIGYVGEETYFAESTALFIPRASSPSRWQASDGSQYLVTAKTSHYFYGPGNQWSTKTASHSFEMQIKRVSPTAVLEPRVPILIPNTDYPGKMRISTSGMPASSLKFEDQTSFVARVRLPNAISGWFQARIENGVIGSTALSGHRTLYEFAGSVAPVIIAGGVVRFSDLAPNFLATLYPTISGIPNGGGLGPIKPGEGTRSIFEYDQWSTYLGEYALTTIDQWNIRSSGWPITNACFSSIKGVSGFLATNAAAYVGLPPDWDPVAGSLNYKVAAPHYDENGEVNVGTYTLSLPVAAAKCLYGSDILPPSVDVTVGSEGGDPNFAAKLGLSELNGWLNFSVKGFHYSSPTIRTKLGRASLSSSANGLLTVKVNRKITARSIAQFAGLKVGSTAKVGMIVSKSSQNRCVVSGSRLVAIATGRCRVTITVTPKGGKATRRTVFVTVTGTPTITRSISASVKAVAEHAGLSVPTTSRVIVKVAKSSHKNCRVSGSRIKGLAKGPCRVSITVFPEMGMMTTRTVNLRVT